MAKNAARRLVLLGILSLTACASLTGREPLSVDVAGIEPLPSEGMEGRFLVKLRVQNPNETPVDFDGVSLRLDVRGQRLATGVSDARGTVPRFGETVLAVGLSLVGIGLNLLKPWPVKFLIDGVLTPAEQPGWPLCGTSSSAGSPPPIPSP